MITNLQIEQFYNSGKESDVKYTFFSNISPTLVNIIREILTNK